MDKAAVPTGLKNMTSVLALAGLLIAAPVTAAPRLPGTISVEVQVRTVRTLTTPPAISNRSSNMMRQGIPLPQIVAGLQAMEPYRDMRYIGVERFDPRTGIYVLRFLNGRQIVVVHVDGRSGRIVNRGF
jgi:hypothetical protein